MFASLSPEVRGPQLMRELGVSNAFVSVLCSIEPTKLSFAFRQLKPLPGHEGQRLVDTLQRLKQVRDAMGIVPLGLVDPQKTAELLSAMDEANVTPEQLGAVVKGLFQQ